MLEGKILSEIIVSDPEKDPTAALVVSGTTKVPAGVQECTVAYLDKTPAYYEIPDGKGGSLYVVNMYDLKSKKLVEMRFPTLKSVEEIFYGQLDEWFKTTNPIWYVVGLSDQTQTSSPVVGTVNDVLVKPGKSGKDVVSQAQNVEPKVEQSSSAMTATAIGYSRKPFLGSGEKILPIKLVKNNLFSSGTEFAEKTLNVALQRGSTFKVDALVKGSSLELTNYQPIAQKESDQSSGTKNSLLQKAASGSATTTGRAMR
jgi:hypothetical protein